MNIRTLLVLLCAGTVATYTVHACESTDRQDTRMHADIMHTLQASFGTPDFERTFKETESLYVKTHDTKYLLDFDIATKFLDDIQIYMTIPQCMLHDAKIMTLIGTAASFGTPTIIEQLGLIALSISFGVVSGWSRSYQGSELCNISNVDKLLMISTSPLCGQIQFQQWPHDVQRKIAVCTENLWNRTHFFPY